MRIGSSACSAAQQGEQGEEDEEAAASWLGDEGS
jgi:hypothetical protein